MSAKYFSYHMFEAGFTLNSDVADRGGLVHPYSLFQGRIRAERTPVQFAPEPPLRCVNQLH